MYRPTHEWMGHTNCSHEFSKQVNPTIYNPTLYVRPNSSIAAGCHHNPRLHTHSTLHTNKSCLPHRNFTDITHFNGLCPPRSIRPEGIIAALQPQHPGV